MRVALYARVSTAKRKAGDPLDPGAERDYQQNPALQLEPMRTYASAHGWAVVGPDKAQDHYFDRASGADPSRPLFRQLLADAGRKRFDVVMCWKFDRVSRGTLHLLQVLEALNAAGVEFVSLTENVDTTTPMGRVTFSIIAALAQFEREQIQERIMAGIASARVRGTKFGRPRVPVPVLLLEQDLAAGMSLTAAAKKRGIARETAVRALRLAAAHQKSADSPAEKPNKRGPE